MLAKAIRHHLTILALLLPFASTRAGDVLPMAVAEAEASPQAATWKEYLAAREAFEVERDAYWTSIADKRRARNAKRRNQQQITLDDYVLTQPPVSNA